MEHSDEQNLNTERYLLGEMQAEEQQAFEEHIFNCRTCGEDVTAAARMFAAGHEIAVAEENGKVRPLPRRGWRSWVPQTVAASIASAFLTFFATRPAPVPLMADRPYYEIKTEETRSAEAKPEPVTVPSLLTFQLPSADEEITGYRYSVRDAKGETLLSKDLGLESLEKSVFIELRRELPRGRYEVVIEGVRKDGNRHEITRSRFEVIGER